MTSLATRTIDALRAEHDALAATVAGLTPAQLEGPSGASEWTVAAVLSHLGSGAEITLAGLRAGTGEAPAPGPDFNQHVWDRWNALSPADQASGVLKSDEALVAAFEALTPDQLETVSINPGFLPAPIPMAAFAGMRLSEVAHHTWDVRVAPDSASVLAEHLSGDLGFFLGFIAKPAAAPAPAVLAIAGSPYFIVLGDSATVTTDATDPTATFTGPLESALRLLVGRLGPDHTPADVTVTGNLTLDDLRAVFPGF
jgi:uncharacterized protein (TIGR03083 family)